MTKVVGQLSTPKASTSFLAGSEPIVIVQPFDAAKGRITSGASYEMPTTTRPWSR
jgi:hypothetical protein